MIFDNLAAKIQKISDFKVSQVLNFFGVKELKELSLRLGVKPNDMLVSFSWQGYLDFSLFTVGFAEDAHARHSSNKFDFCTRLIASFTFHFNS